jgi:predicted enzyme related to lactoylglutathione lyase
MSSNVKLLVYPVNDLGQAKVVFSELLGVEPYADAPYSVGYRVGDLEIGLDPNGAKKGALGPIAYWETADIKQSLQHLLEAGAQIQQAITDVGRGRLIALVKDASGNFLGLMQDP